MVQYYGYHRECGLQYWKFEKIFIYRKLAKINKIKNLAEEKQNKLIIMDNLYKYQLIQEKNAECFAI